MEKLSKQKSDIKKVCFKYKKKLEGSSSFLDMQLY
jgi:hypothetical protein